MFTWTQCTTKSTWQDANSTLLQKQISRTQIEFSWMLNFTSWDFNVNSRYCLPYISYFLLVFNRFLKLSRTSSLFPGLSSSGKFPGFAGPAAWTWLTIISHVQIQDQLKSLLTQRCKSTYLPGPCDERLFRIRKVSVTASEVRDKGKKPISSKLG